MLTKKRRLREFYGSNQVQVQISFEQQQWEEKVRKSQKYAYLLYGRPLSSGIAGSVRPWSDLTTGFASDCRQTGSPIPPPVRRLRRRRPATAAATAARSRYQAALGSKWPSCRRSRGWSRRGARGSAAGRSDTSRIIRAKGCKDLLRLISVRPGATARVRSVCGV